MSSKDDVSLDEMLAEVARHVPADKQHLLAGHRTELRDMRNLGEYCKRLRQLFGADMLVKILTGLKGLQAKRVEAARAQQARRVEEAYAGPEQVHG